MSNSELTLTHVVRKPTKGSKASPPLLLLLHGIGSNENDLMELASQIDERFFVISARAPISLGPSAYAWFHVQFVQPTPVINFKEAESSLSALVRFIDEAVDAYSLDSKRVYLMGFSQGAIMASSVGLTKPDRVAGVVAMSGRIPPEIRPLLASPEALAGLPIMVVHGVYDSVLPIRHGRESRDLLSTLPVNLTYKEYEMGHEVTDESLRDISMWLTSRLDSEA